MSKILIVVDMQRDFIDMVLGSIDAQGIVSNVVEKIRATFEENRENYIIYTMDTHYTNDVRPKDVGIISDTSNSLYYSQSVESRSIPIHCVFNSEGWQLHPDIKPYAEYMGKNIVIKNSFGFINWKKYDSYFRSVDEIELVGLCTDICVVSNALILRSTYPDKKIIVDASCCAGTTIASHLSALDVLSSNCIEIINRQQAFKKNIGVDTTELDVILKDGTVLTPSLISAEWRNVDNYIKQNFKHLPDVFLKIQSSHNVIKVAAVKYNNQYYWIKHTELSSTIANVSLKDFIIVTPRNIDLIFQKMSKNPELMKYIIIDIDVEKEGK